MVALPDRVLLTGEEYLQWEPSQGERYEYWDGEVVAMTGGTRAHNRIAFNFSKLIDAGLLGRGCGVYINDVKVQVEPGRKYYYPDVVVTCDDRDDDERFVQFPCLIVEVLSPATEAVDRGAKFAHYRQFSTLQEYVLVTATVPVVEVFTKNGQGQWVLTEYGEQDVVTLAAIDLEIPVAAIYQQVKFGAGSAPVLSAFL
jgi:Uma2 family endonuclease